MVVRLTVLLFFGILFFQFSVKHDPLFERHETLSAYGFFKGTLSSLDPSPGVVPYDLNSPLFSNYAEKLRFVKLPAGTAAIFNDTATFSFPIGTVLIKNFLYPNDFRKPEKGRRILETRLLVNTENGWDAFPYIWNEAQTDATYDPAGETLTVTYSDAAGKKIKAPYVIPNKNQCKGCHIRDEIMQPIGPAARHLNKDFTYETKTENQLTYWERNAMLEDVPANKQALPRLADYRNPSSGSLDDRARAYLDINCGHCHNRVGPASTSGLFLDVYERDSTHLGIFKTPVAAGRGAGDFQYDIVPGDPAHSILVYRMKAIDPAIAMPEIGREQVHAAGVQLIEEWIRELPKN